MPVPSSAMMFVHESVIRQKKARVSMEFYSTRKSGRGSITKRRNVRRWGDGLHADLEVREISISLDTS